MASATVSGIFKSRQHFPHRVQSKWMLKLLSLGVAADWQRFGQVILLEWEIARGR